MVLRLVLVSIVASLGMTPPADDERADWSRTVQTWLDARLAEWCACQAPGAGPQVPLAAAVADPDPAAGLAALDEELAALLADQTATVAPVAAANGDEPGRVEAVLAALDDELAELIREEIPAGPAEKIEIEIETVTVTDSAFEILVEEMVADFARDDTATETGAAPISAPAAVVAERADDDEFEGFFEDEELIVEVAGMTVPAPANIPMPDGEDAFLMISEDLGAGLTSELSRQADRLESQPPLTEDAPPAACPTAGNPLTDAVRLTRAALYAWLNVLQSPAIVTVPQ